MVFEIYLTFKDIMRVKIIKNKVTQILKKVIAFFIVVEKIKVINFF